MTRRKVLKAVAVIGLALLAVIGVAVCAPAAPVASPPEDWPTVEPRRSDGTGFSLRLPPGWQFYERQGIDSYVGEFVGNGTRLTFNYGIYSGSLPYEDNPAYTVVYEEIGGRNAKLVRPKEASAGVTGVYFEDFGPTVRRPSVISLRLVISGRDLTPDQQSTVFDIFRSIRSLGFDYPPATTPSR